MLPLTKYNKTICTKFPNNTTGYAFSLGSEIGKDAENKKYKWKQDNNKD